MANRKKAEKAAIDFSVEMSTPPAPSTPKKKPTKPKKPVVTASEALPGLRKAQREAAVKPHPRAAADKAKRQMELKSAAEEARMPAQPTFEAERHVYDREGFPAREAARQAQLAKEESERKDFARNRYETAPVREDEIKKANLIRLRTRAVGKKSGSNKGGN